MHDLLNAKPLFAFYRKAIPEVVVHGIVGFKQQGSALKGNDPETTIVTRSLLKPWQALAAGHFDGNDHFWAMAIKS